MNYNFRDRTGEKYGELTVIRRVSDAKYSSGKLVRWLCQCSCGNYKIVIGCNLSKTKSCGCKQYGSYKLEDLTGQKFGLLTVLDRADNKIIPCGQQQTMWKCKCECGSIVDVRAAHLKDGLTKSCGCIKSYNERYVAELLTSLNVEFVREYVFDDCISKKGNRLPFDFAIVQDNDLLCLIEYQGEQHYKEFPNGFGALQREETDMIKKEYCLTHNIPLFEIRFDENIDERIDEILNAIHDNTVPSVS